MAKPTNTSEGLLHPEQLVDLVAEFIRDCRQRPAAAARAEEAGVMPATAAPGHETVGVVH